MNDATTDCFVGGMSKYRDGAPSGCSGVFHEVTFRWIRGGTAMVGQVKTATVCEGHMDQFKALGAREEEGFVYEIESDRVLDKPIGPEKEL